VIHCPLSPRVSSTGKWRRDVAAPVRSRKALDCGVDERRGMGSGGMSRSLSDMCIADLASATLAGGMPSQRSLSATDLSMQLGRN